MHSLNTNNTVLTSEIYKEISKASHVYESFKDPNQHPKIINLCKENCFAEDSVKKTLKFILKNGDVSVEDGDFSVEDGLSELSDLSSASRAPCWKDLGKDAHQYLAGISRSFPQLVKKAESSIATTGSFETVFMSTVSTSTSNTGQFGEVSVEEATPSALRVALGAAFKKATDGGLVERDQYDKEFDKMFYTDSDIYRDAYKEVVEREGRHQSQQKTVTETLCMLMDTAIEFVAKIDVAAQNRVDSNSTEQTDLDHLHAAAIDALFQFVSNNLSFNREQITELMNQVLKPDI
jgi:hypothetical protein